MVGSVPSFNKLTGNESIEELREEVARMQKTLDHLLRHLSSKNITEIGGWFVNQNELSSKDGDVGMSTEDTGADDVRFFAGGVDKDSAPWKVTKSGKMTATGALIQSANGYPKVSIDPNGDLIAAYSDADSYVALVPDESGAPALAIYDSGIKGLLQYLSGFKLALLSTSGGTLQIGAGGNLELFAGLGYKVKFEDWSDIYSIGDTQTLQDALNNLATQISDLTSALAGKATSGVSTGSGGSHNHGIADGTQLSTPGGGFVTWVSAGNHSHSQT